MQLLGWPKSSFGFFYDIVQKKPNELCGTITIKSNPIPSGWETHNLENSDMKEVLALL